jgi:hypothetical protein
MSARRHFRAKGRNMKSTPEGAWGAAVELRLLQQVNGHPRKTDPAPCTPKCRRVDQQGRETVLCHG